MNVAKNRDFSYESAEQVELAFYKAFGEGDFILMESLIADKGVSYSHTGDVTLTGREKVVNNWQFLLTDIPKTQVDREIINVTHGDGVEKHLVLESFLSNKKTGEVSEIFTTNTYVEQENGWRLQVQNASAPN